MENQNNFMANSPVPANHPMVNLDKIEKMYPEVHKRMAPHVENAVAMFAGHNNLTEDMVNTMANNVLTNSGLAANPPLEHNRNTLNDIARALVLEELFENNWDKLDNAGSFGAAHGDPPGDPSGDPPPFFWPAPFFPPFFYFPFGGRGSHNHRRPGRYPGGHHHGGGRR